MNTWTSTRPGWLHAVWAATALYLVVELSFNSRLLDVVGGGATLDEVDAIELWGRSISGFALALFFWPGWIRALYDGARGWFMATVHMVLRTLLVIVCVYAAQEMLVRWLVDKSSPEQLRSAQHLVLLQTGLHRNLVDLDGLGLDQAQMSRPDGKALLAMLPLLGTGLGDQVQADFGPELRADVTRKLVITAMGDPNERLRHYVELYQALEEMYGPFHEARAGIDAEAAKQWTEYRRKLRASRINPDAPPRRYHTRIRRDVRAAGVYVPDSWHPTDRKGFLAAAVRGPLATARGRLQSAVGEHVPALAGVELPDHAASLFTEQARQPPLLRALGYACIESFDAREAGTGATGFKRALYDREVDCQAAARTTADGDPEAGREARRALLVPFIALVFSLYGALAHIAKFALYTLTLVRGYPLFPVRGLFGAITVFTPVLGIALCAWLMSSPATDNALYGQLERRLPAWISVPVRGTIHGQKLGYPLFEGMRLHALRGFDFGYRGDPPPEGAPGDGAGAGTDAAGGEASEP